MERSSDKSRLKVFAIALVTIIVIASLGAVVFLFINTEKAVEYTGVIVAKSMVTDSFDDGYQFTGRPTDDPDSVLQSFSLSTTIDYHDVIGGRFLIKESDGDHFLESTASADTVAVTDEQVPSMMSDTYTNLELTMTSISLVYSDYTFGIGTSEQGDFIWIAPRASYPTFFNEIDVKGTIIDSDSLEAMTNDIHATFLGSADLQYVLELAEDFDMIFDGQMNSFLMVEDVEYTETVQVRGDVIDTITPNDLEDLSEIFCPSGMEWISEVVGNIGQGFAFVSEEHSTIYQNELWVVLFPLDMGTRFDGICQIEVSQSSFSLIDLKVNLDRSCFKPITDSVSFVVNLGVMVDVRDSTYTDTSVPSLWGMMDQGTASQVGSVHVTGYGVGVDYQTLSECFDEALGVGDAEGALSTLSTFKNPAFIFLLDQDFRVFAEDDVPIWNYATVCIIPDYTRDSSAFRYLSVEGTAYDLSNYFGSMNPIFSIPLIIADDCSEGAENCQQVCIKDMRADDLDYQNIGGQNGAFVEFDAKPIGTSLLSLFSVTGGLSPLASKLLPVDLGFYIAFQRDGDGLHYVPVIYLSAGKGSSYFGTDSFDIRGAYIDFSHYSSTVNDLVDEASENDNASMLLPTGMVLAFSMDRIELELSDAMAYGPTNTTDEAFSVRYSMDPSLLDDPGIVVELYWTNEEGLIWTTWNYYGRDPTPGDGLFPVDYSLLYGDGEYGWFIRVKNEAHQADDSAPGMWDCAEAHTRINIQAPEAIYQNYPEAPAPGTSMILSWRYSEDPFFDHYEIYYGYDAEFLPSSDHEFNDVYGRYSTSLTVINAQPGTQYYFIVRVVDIDGLYADSNVMYTRTYQDVDSGGTLATARLVQQNTAWTEQTTMILDTVDYFKIYLMAGQTLTVDMRGNMAGGGDLYLYDSDGYCRDMSTNVGVEESVHITAAASGFYYVKVNVGYQGTDWYTLWFHVS